MWLPSKTVIGKYKRLFWFWCTHLWQDNQNIIINISVGICVNTDSRTINIYIVY